VGEAMMACVLADHLLRHRAQCGDGPRGVPGAGRGGA
jgi:chorismate synthase